MLPRVRALVALTLALILCAAGDAHPLGMASVNRYLGVKAHAQELELRFLLDLAEISAWTEIERLDGDHDGRVTPGEREAWLARFVPEATRESASP